MTRFLAIIRVTLLQLIGRRRSIGLLVLAALPAVILLLVGLNATTGTPRSSSAPESFPWCSA